MRGKSEYLWAAAALLAMVLTLVYGRESADAVAEAINSCLTVIIPSLYIFMVLSAFLTSSGLYSLLARPFAFLSEKIFRLRADLFPMLLISLIGGYPVGAKLTSDMLDSGRITSCEANRLYIICYGGGPAFITGMVGYRLFDSGKIGMIIFLSTFLAGLITAMLCGILCGRPEKKASAIPVKVGAEQLVGSVISGGKAIFTVCVTIVFFSAVMRILELTGVLGTACTAISMIFPITEETAAVLMRGFLEISRLSELPRHCYSLLPIIAALFSFGGVCVILQVIALSKGRLPLLKFLIVRAISSLLSGIICKILIAFAVKDIAVTAMPQLGIRQITPFGAIFLLIMTILLLYEKNDSNYL